MYQFGDIGTMRCQCRTYPHSSKILVANAGTFLYGRGAAGKETAVNRVNNWLSTNLPTAEESSV